MSGWCQFPQTQTQHTQHTLNTHTNQVGEPHVAALPLAGNTSMGAPAVIVRHDGFFRRDKLWRGAGVALPVFALRTQVRVFGCVCVFVFAAGARAHGRFCRPHTHSHSHITGVTGCWGVPGSDAPRGFCRCRWPALHPGVFRARKNKIPNCVFIIIVYVCV